MLTVKELFEIARYSTIRVVSDYSGRVLCYKFSPDKHPEISSRKIINVYAALDTERFSGEISARAYVCAVVDDGKEYEKYNK